MRLEKSKKRNVLRALLLGVLAVVMVIPMDVLAATNPIEIKASTTVSDTEAYVGDTIDVQVNLESIIHDTTVLTEVVATDIVLVLDSSGSMSSSISQLIDASNQFVDNTDLTKHKIGIVMFGVTGATNQIQAYPFSQDKESIKANLSAMKAQGSTPTAEAILEAIDMLGDGSAKAKTIILMTDGIANDEAKGVEAAAKAKEAGYICYTVGINAGTKSEVLKAMATTAKHHYAPTPAELPQVYQEISETIGVPTAYDVRVYQTVEDAFSIVTKSADDNIPVPTINGNTITWNMKQIHNDTLQFSYQMKVKEDAEPGITEQTSSAKVVYKDYKGNVYGINIEPKDIVIKYKTPVITKLSAETFSIEGGEAITIKGENFYESTVVYVGDNRLKDIVIVDSNTIKATMPSLSKNGDMLLRVVNADGGQDSVSVSIQTQPIIDRVISASGLFEGGNVVTVQGDYFLSGVKVYFDGVEAQVNSVTDGAIKVTVPFLNKAGSVAVKVANPDGTTREVTNAYTYQDKVIAEITGLRGVPNTTTGQIKITGENIKLDYNPLVEVELAGQRIPISNLYSSYFVFYAPTDLTGTQVVTAYMQDGTKAKGSVVLNVPIQPVVTTKATITSLRSYNKTSRVVAINGTDIKDETNPLTEVEIGGQRIPVSNLYKKYFRFTAPADLGGTLEVTGYLKDGTKANGSVMVTLPDVPQPTVGELESLRYYNKTTGVVAINGINIKDDNNPLTEVEVAGQRVAVTKLCSKYFAFPMPAGITGTVTVTGYMKNGAKAKGSVDVVATTPAAKSSAKITELTYYIESTRAARVKGESLKEGDLYVAEVKLGTTMVQVNKCYGSHFLFDVPAGLKGTYTITAYLSDGTKVDGNVSITIP